VLLAHLVHLLVIAHILINGGQMVSDHPHPCITADAAKQEDGLLGLPCDSPAGVTAEWPY
jgi:hypothetical protein